ncbi:uncharacterized protein K452DRAFT_71144 [Aplosporella prunicola CBS 121167]|uniref:Uncharacterized protein n=1 Tax=Aplosporella prunicola CBS 121167 TaxID=1176127 RepID=A0A6A6BVD3_9PEZI|nr:uncharacterized protein K452DRAFT_71144 [Aplosporella prunicola CBS 121167]KAF2146807.1 hypothetical protein K452DRAFT_71144 [Aplosporella prunicola CBS 121167]
MAVRRYSFRDQSRSSCAYGGTIKNGVSTNQGALLEQGLILRALLGILSIWTCSRKSIPAPKPRHRGFHFQPRVALYPISAPERDARLNPSAEDIFDEECDSRLIQRLVFGTPSGWCGRSGKDGALELFAVRVAAGLCETGCVGPRSISLDLGSGVK